jgi:hypothetical protein
MGCSLCELDELLVEDFLKELALNLSEILDGLESFSS